MTSHGFLCHSFFGGKYDLNQLHRQIIHQDAQNCFFATKIPSPPAISEENNENDMTFYYFSWLSRCCFRHTSSAAHSSSALLFNSRRNLFAEKVQNCNSHFDDLILGCFPFQDGRKIRDRNRVHKCLLGWTPTRFLGYLTAQAV